MQVKTKQSVPKIFTVVAFLLISNWAQAQNLDAKKEAPDETRLKSVSKVEIIVDSTSRPGMDLRSGSDDEFVLQVVFTDKAFVSPVCEKIKDGQKFQKQSNVKIDIPMETLLAEGNKVKVKTLSDLKIDIQTLTEKIKDAEKYTETIAVTDSSIKELQAIRNVALSLFSTLPKDKAGRSTTTVNFQWDYLKYFLDGTYPISDIDKLPDGDGKKFFKLMTSKSLSLNAKERRDLLAALWDETDLKQQVLELGTKRKQVESDHPLKFLKARIQLWEQDSPLAIPFEIAGKALRFTGHRTKVGDDFLKEMDLDFYEMLIDPKPDKIITVSDDKHAWGPSSGEIPPSGTIFRCIVKTVPGTEIRKKSH